MTRAGDMLAAMNALPMVDPRSLVGEMPVLVLTPHPDDETFGCGGLIAACRSRGQAVYVLVLTDGAGSHRRSRAYPPERLVALRAAETREAVGALGVPEDCVDFLGLPDGHLAAHAGRGGRAVGQAVEYGRSRGIRTILCTWLHDPHADHRAAYRMSRRVAEELDARLLCYPVWSWTIPPEAWLPHTVIRGGRVDIAGHLAAKRRAIACYRSQTTNLIQDDPTAFCMSPEVLAYFERPYEVLLTNPERE